MKFYTNSGKLNVFSSEYRIATFLLIQSLIEKRKVGDYITLSEMKETLNAYIEERTNGMRVAIDELKKMGVIGKVKGKKGVYEILMS